MTNLLWFSGGDVRDRQVPVRQQYLEAALLLPFISGLVGIELLDQGFFVGIGGRCKGRVLEDDGDAVVPAGVLSHVVGRGLDLDGEHSPGGDDLLEERVMVFEKEVEELPLMSPLGFVVELDGVGRVGGPLRRSSLGENRECGGSEKEGEQETLHGGSI